MITSGKVREALSLKREDDTTLERFSGVELLLKRAGWSSRGRLRDSEPGQLGYPYRQLPKTERAAPAG